MSTVFHISGTVGLQLPQKAMFYGVMLILPIIAIFDFAYNQVSITHLYTFATYLSWTSKSFWLFSA